MEEITIIENRKLRLKFIAIYGTVGLLAGLFFSVILLNCFYGVLQLIGFGSRGITSESWAAKMESEYHGHIPKGGWFAGNICAKL